MVLRGGADAVLPVAAGEGGAAAGHRWVFQSVLVVPYNYNRLLLTFFHIFSQNC